jgi:outer membrane protein assembly factor BamE (lipoprotein component of BamABCDE complex)
MILLTTLLGCSSSSGNKSISEVSSYKQASKVIKKGMNMGDVEVKLGRPLFVHIVNNEVVWHYSYKVAGLKRLATSVILRSLGSYVDPSNRTKRLKVSFIGRHVSNIQYIGSEVNSLYSWWDYREIDSELEL